MNTSVADSSVTGSHAGDRLRSKKDRVISLWEARLREQVATLAFDFEEAKLREIGEVALAFTRFSELGVGALILVEFVDRVSATLLVSRDRDGTTWIDARAVDRGALWAALRTELQKPLPAPCGTTSYDEQTRASHIRT